MSDSCSKTAPEPQRVTKAHAYSRYCTDGNTHFLGMLFKDFLWLKNWVCPQRRSTYPTRVQLPCDLCPAGFSLMYCTFLLCFPTLLLPQEHCFARELPGSWDLFKPHPFHVSFYNCHVHKILSLKILWELLLPFSFFETGSHCAAQAGLELATWLTLVSNSRSIYFSLLDATIMA